MILDHGDPLPTDDPGKINTYTFKYVQLLHDGYPSHVIPILHAHDVEGFFEKGTINSMEMDKHGNLHLEPREAEGEGARTEHMNAKCVQGLCDLMCSFVEHVYMYDREEDEWMVDRDTLLEMRKERWPINWWLPKEQSNPD